MSVVNRKTISFAALFFIAVLGVISCSSEDDNDGGEGGKTDIEKGRQMQVQNLYNNQIAPLQQSHIAVTATLLEKTQDFTNSVDVSSLEELKAAWKDAFLVWKNVEVYNLGEIQSSFLHTGIDQYPINISLIENNIKGGVEIDKSYIASLGVNAKGCAAVEYLIFDKENQAILEDFINAENADRRGQYLVALAQNLDEKANQLSEAWGSYENSFKTNLETGVDGSQNQTVNAVVAAIENIKNKKIDKALNSNPPDVNMLEAFRSGESKAAISENLKTVKATYTGDFNGESGFGIEEYVSETLNRPDLDTNIKAAFEDARTALDAIQDPLKVSIIEQTEQVEEFQQKITDLIALFKADLSSAANIVITFNDNDGD